MSTELNSLFERTMPPDDVVLTKMTHAKQRQELSSLFERTMPPDDVILARMHRARQGSDVSLHNRGRVVRGFQWSIALSTAAALLLLINNVRSGLLTQEGPTILAEQGSANSGSQVLERDSLSQDARPSPTPNEQTPLEALDDKNQAFPSRPKDPRAPLVSKTSAALPRKHDLEPPPPEPKSATWESAAQALRSGNREEATRLLAQLSESEKPETRDAATLVRLHAAVQKAASAQSSAPLAPEELNQLRALAQSGATASIRASARRLLNEVE